ncbi:tetratricopeptide repeat protein [Bryobacter aggregatus]|uniref:tetratricopeptide repeat protein n=1 Tax=Bryobacter aggregatus TaxID=360054 RepID=UPI0004E177A6|nr:tetratricopeptide repeat protein [Bryobacter aggregatus]
MRARVFTPLVLLMAFSSCQKEEKAVAREASVSSAQCAGCHPKEAASYRHVAMSRSFATLGAAPEFVEGRVAHAASGRQYAVLRRNGKLIQRRWELGPQGREEHVMELEATHVIGSGHHAKTYVHRQTSGEMIELPLSWYSQEKRWDLSPGFDQPTPKDFTRLVDERCLFCHNGYPDAEGKLAEGIDCQRCHGPGARHVELASAGKPAAAAIVNPKKLDPVRQEEVCLQCHLETTSAELPAMLRRFDRAADTFRPGETPGTYVVHFDDGRSDKFEVVNQGYRMRQSACYLKSGGKLQCTSCHSPHAARAADFRTQCLSCHTAPHRTEDCISCHMPRRPVDDVPHVRMTDHKIAIPGKERTATAQGLDIYAPALRGPDRDLYLGAALVLNGKGRKEGIAMLERVADAPGRGLAVLGEAYFAEGRLADAMATLRRALEKEPSLPKAHYNLGQVLAASGNPEEGRKELETALRLQPRFPEAEFTLANLLLKQGLPQDAEAHYQAALHLRPVYAEAASNLGSLLLSAGRLDAAQAALETALRIDPALATAHNNLGRFFAEKQDWAASLRHLQRAVKLDPSSLESSFNLAGVLQQSGDLRGAISAFRALLRSHPDFADGHLGLGQCLGDAGQIDAAIAEFREALRLRPGHPLAQQNLAVALSLRGR